MSLRPNPPRMITVIIAAGLLVVGLVGVLSPSTAVDIIRSLPLEGEQTRELARLARDETLAYLSLLGSSLLLVAGSLLPGI